MQNTSVPCKCFIDLLDLRALLGFERWQSDNKGLPLGSIKDHLGIFGAVEASRIEVGLMESNHLVLRRPLGKCYIDYANTAPISNTLVWFIEVTVLVRCPY